MVVWYLVEKDLHKVIIAFTSSASLFQKSTRSGVNTKSRLIPNTFNSFRFQVSIGSDTFNTFHHQASSGNAKRQQNGANNKPAKANYLRQATLAQYSEKTK